MEKLSFKLDQFEGPLDLLLYLLAKHKMDILEIEITSLLDQYLEVIQQMQKADMDVASEFLEMASRLVYLKTLSLLPRHEEEREQLTRELTGQLLEYHLCQQVAQALGDHYVGETLFVRSPMPLETGYTYSLCHSVQELARAYQAAVGKAGRKLPPPEDAFRPLVSRRIVSVSSRIIFVMKLLYRRQRVSMEDLFGQARDRSELVATFLAVLELIKGGRVSVMEDQELAFRNAGVRG